MAPVAIVGGGISGLFLAFKLLSKNKGYDVHIFEKSDSLGGRIQTVYRDDGSNIMYDVGAGRFNDSHIELLKLLHEFSLSDKATAITNNKRSYIKNGEETSYTKLIDGLLFKKIVLKSRAKYTDDYLKSITLGELLVKVLGKEKTEDVISAFGYNSEFEIHNAFTALEIFEHDFSDKIQYYYLKGGLSQIIAQLHHKVIELGGHIHLNTIVNHYEPSTNIIEYVGPTKSKGSSKVKKITCLKVVFCVTHDCLERFEDLVEHDKNLSKFLKGTQSAPLHRIFARFPLDKTGKSWFDGLPRTTTNLPIRYIIPHNPANGFIQICYTDNRFATYWNDMSKEEREKKLLKNLKLVFPDRKIPKPIWVDSHYWHEGVTYWKPNSKGYKNVKSNNYYICGEMTSPFHCGWIEGALRTTKDVVRLFT
jgi:protoporphyrinogen oxidase